MANKVSKGKAQRMELNSFTEHVEDDYALVIGFEVDESRRRITDHYEIV
ncbi:hypothetical protein HYE59_07685 [Aggregatibacter actinomycetemcomitans]|nr:hypothetical protein [Aggregatibacter actinomycetemcomitans]MBN6076130.1 hypothetical protein [Aggregatibacter actinomycetemcomitans]MBN6076134.1 hypothetical protein [Aggregatibacter actinomycetemcomitans]MBN6076936.1 hypothetical protein [Aggregatibacter actinomycetemcomitans]MBN6076942.1 hypothetical protein [Aggregatibacter actinomycetemcomitans]MBN6077019.1 hypothetical protein [Aggregatibacter actinomycetemcomitans]